MQVRARDRDGVNLGQFFLENKEILKKIVDLAAIQPNEVVLEIGAGDGRLTKLLAQKARKVITLEIDKKFLPELKKLPKNVEVIIGDGLSFLSEKPFKKLAKIVANLSSTLVEPIFHKLVPADFQSAIFLVPEKFAYKLTSHPVLSAYFDIKLIDKVSKKSFLPVPRTNWEIISVARMAEPLESGRIDLFFIRYVYEHPLAKLKNSLMEAVIKIFASKGKKITKNQAREVVNKVEIENEILEALPDNFLTISKIAKDLSVLL